MPEKPTIRPYINKIFIDEIPEKKPSTKETLSLFSDIYRHYQSLQSSVRNLEASYPPLTSPKGEVLLPTETEEIETRKKELLLSGNQAVSQLKGALETMLKSPLGQEAWEKTVGRSPKVLSEAEEQVSKLISDLVEQYKQTMAAVKRNIKDENTARAEAARLTLGLGESPDPTNPKKTKAWEIQKRVGKKVLTASLAVPGNKFADENISTACSSLLDGSDDAAQAALCLEALRTFSTSQPKSLLEVDNNYLEADLKLLAGEIKYVDWLIEKTAKLVGKEIKPISSVEFVYNKEKAAEFGLEQVELPAFLEADRLIARVINKTLENGRPNPDYINISAKAGREQFCRLWKEKNGDLPLPCVPPETLFNELYPGKEWPKEISKAAGDFWYLQQLAAGKIVKNLNGEAQPLLPHYGQKQVILAEKWDEDDWDAKTGRIKKLQSAEYTSKLLEAFGINTQGVVNIKREDIDSALWQGDPANRQPTQKHQEVLREFGVDPSKLVFRCIAQDEYARGALLKQWGNKNLWTNFDGFFFEDAGRYGLYGGHSPYGGASYVNDCWRAEARGDLAFRFVLSRKQD